MDWIFSHTEELNTIEMDVDNEEDQAQSGPSFIDGPGSKHVLFVNLFHFEVGC